MQILTLHAKLQQQQMQVVDSSSSFIMHQGSNSLWWGYVTLILWERVPERNSGVMSTRDLKVPLHDTNDLRVVM